MNIVKEKKLVRILVIITLMLILCGTIVTKILHVGISESIVTDYGKTVPVKKGVSVTPSVIGNVSDEQIDELVDEYGTDSNIVIYDVGR